jgi:hypothetical protein
VFVFVVMAMGMHTSAETAQSLLLLWQEKCLLRLPAIVAVLCSLESASMRPVQLLQKAKSTGSSLPRDQTRFSPLHWPYLPASGLMYNTAAGRVHTGKALIE